MKPVSVFKKHYHVEIRDVDFTKKLKLSALFNYIQETASRHVENLGTGVETIEKRCQAAWIFMRARVEIERYPLWNEDITIETWQPTPRKFEFERDFIVRNAAGQVIMRMASIWIIVDIKTRALKNTDAIAVEYPPVFEERALNTRPEKIKPFPNRKVAYTKKICYSDTDINGHINNAKYIDLATDCFPVEQHLRYLIKSMQINYVREAVPGDSIIVYTDISELNSNIVYIGGVQENDGSAIFNAVVEIIPAKDRPEHPPGESPV